MKSGSSTKHGAQGREPRSLQRLVSRHWVEAPDGEMMLHIEHERFLSVREIQTAHGGSQFEALKVFRDEVVRHAGIHDSKVEAQYAAEMTTNDEAERTAIAETARQPGI